MRTGNGAAGQHQLDGYGRVLGRHGATTGGSPDHETIWSSPIRWPSGSSTLRKDAITTLHTVGHGTLPADVFNTLLVGAHVGPLVDVRSFPGSRRNPQFGREEMQRWVPAAGIGYVWIHELGGRRRPVAGSKHVALRHDSFRAYADHMETGDFLAGVDELLALAAGESTAVMCSESVWWRCHRRLLADHLMLVRGIEVVHLMHDGRLTPHAPTQGVRLAGDALIYDVGVTPPLSTD